MRWARSIALILAFAAVGVVLVHLRTTETQIAADLLRAESDRARLRREWWSLQSSAANLTTPARIHWRSRMFRRDRRLLVQSDHIGAGRFPADIRLE